jgi:NADPH:quinone reductase-like Zn-dependent oxidoreductase
MITQERDSLHGIVDTQRKEAIEGMFKVKDELLVSLRQTESIVLSSTENARIVAEKSMAKTRDEILDSIRSTREETIKKLLDTRDVVISAANNTKDTTLESMFKSRDEVITTVNSGKTSLTSVRDEALTQLKNTQKEVEESINKKLESDKENTEKIKQIMKTMNELIRA